MDHDTRQPLPAEPALSDADARALDALLENGGPRGPDNRPRLQLTTTEKIDPSANLSGWLATLSKAPVAPVPDDLAARTIARIQRAKAQQEAIENEGMSVGGSLRWPELAAGIAIVLTGVLLALPALDHSRSDARRAACADNLGASGQSLAQYAVDNKGSLPRYATAPGSVWWNVGKSAKGQPPRESNSGNLYNLIHSRFVAASRLNCPENKSAIRNASPDDFDWPHAAAVSYSYQNQFAPRVPSLERNAGVALLADKNPLFAGVTGGSASYVPSIPNNSPSDFHRGRGQNILTASGAVSWQKTPVLPNGDNIWVTRSPHERYNGTETNSDPDDSFLVP